MQNILEHETKLPDAENVAKLLELLNPLLVGEPNASYEASVRSFNYLSR